MTQENKELLLKDLCARLPYGVKVAFFNEDLDYHSEPKTLTGIECINNLNYSRLEDEDGNTTIVEFIKPYLFPLSSMTEEQKKELEDTLINLSLKSLSDEINGEDVATYEIDFYNKHHIDYRGLIPQGLVLDATYLNIY